LNDSSFPRTDPRLGFDLMADRPRLGDQSKREDDRYLFLETLLSARERFYLSYVGQSIRDNSPAPPSVLVSELLDYIDQGFIVENGNGPVACEAAATPAETSSGEEGAARAGISMVAESNPAPGGSGWSATPGLAGWGGREGQERRGRSSRRNRVSPNQLSFDLDLSTAWAPAPEQPEQPEPEPDLRGSSGGTAEEARAVVEGNNAVLGTGRTVAGVGGGKLMAMEAGTPREPEALPSSRLVCKHRLQAFSADYFGGDSKLFSYSLENFRAGLALRLPRKAERFVHGALPEAGDEWRTVDLDMLAEFFANPARFFLTRRLDIRLPRLEAGLLEREPMELGGLDYFELKNELLEKRLAGQKLLELRASFLASGRLPVGQLGEIRYRELCDSIEDLYARLLRYQPQERAEVAELDLVLGDFRVVGRFPHVTSKALLAYRPSQITPKDRMRTWVRHVAWCATATAGYPRHSVLVGEQARVQMPGALEYQPLETKAARGVLAELLELYWRGLREPLRFFPKTSLKFAEIDLNNGERGPETWRDSLGKARGEWETDRFKEGEQDDDYFKICFHQFDPLDGDFIALAQQIGGPLLEHEKRAR
jgi:exonuclease V gamma subunit